MSVEFRQRTPGEYARMLWRRKWMIVLPTVAVALAVGYVVRKLPNLYESTTLLTVRPATINTQVVPQLSDSDLTMRINNIGQEVTSRSSLEPLIERFKLYEAERQRGEQMDALVERMRTRDIRVEINQGRNDITNGFYLAFRGSDPRVTQAVTSELASKYTNAQTKLAQGSATMTKEFFEQRLQQAKEQLDAVDLRRLQVMTAKSASLPSSMNALVAQLGGLREEQKSFLSAIGLLRERISLLNTQRADLEKQRVQEVNNISENIGDPKQSPVYAQYISRKNELESQRQQLLAVFKPKHPDVIAKESEIAKVQRDIDELLSDSKNKIEEKRKKLESQIDPRLNSIKYELTNTASQVEALEKRMATNAGQIADIDRRLNDVPNTEVELEKINREYLSQKSVYDDLLKQKEKADLFSDVAATAQGESIAVIDAASLPGRPVAPNRPLLYLLGIAAGLGIGFLLAAAFEVPSLLTIQTSQDAAHYTALPVLVTLPNMLTAPEQRRLKLRRAAFAFTGVAAAIFSVPALIIFLRVTHIIELFASRG